jgi:hypothetical protein
MMGISVPSTESATQGAPPRPRPGSPVIARQAAVELTPEAIEQIARRVAELLAGERPAPGGLVDAATVARHYGLTRAWVYQHAEQLGAIAIGTGPKPRLRFDLHAVGEVLRTPGRRAQPTAESAPAPSRPRRRQKKPAPEVEGDLLPINARLGPRAASRP